MVVLTFADFVVVAILTELTGALAGVLRMLGGRVDILYGMGRGPGWGWGCGLGKSRWHGSLAQACTEYRA